MQAGEERKQNHETGKRSRLPPRPGVVVCICSARGNVLLHDPDAYRKAQAEAFVTKATGIWRKIT